MKNQTANRIESRIEGRIEGRKEKIGSGAQYAVVSEEVYLPELGICHTFGIKATAEDCVEILHDVSVCEHIVRNIVERINLYQLSPVHLHDFVQDVLS